MPNETTVSVAEFNKAKAELAELTRRFNTHKHLGSDNSTKIEMPTVAAETLYTGRCVSNAAGTPFPSGWTLSHPSTGNYQVTHNLGVDSYGLVATLSNAVGYIKIANYGATVFNINTRSTAAADADCDWSFVLKYIG